MLDAQKQAVDQVLQNPGLTPVMLNHAAWVKHDVVATTDFYTRIMGMEFGITTPLDTEWNRHTKKGYEDLAKWTECKEQAGREGKDVPQALVAMIREMRKRYEN